MDTTQPSETPTPILEIFSEKILEEIILQYFGVIDEVERIINEFVDNKPIPDLLIADHLKEYEKNELGNIQQNIQSLNNFDIYDSLSLACLSGVYYNLSKVDFFAKIETRITNYPSLVLNLKDKIRDKFLGYSDSYIQTNKLNIESLSKREKYHIDQIHYLFLEKVNKLEDKIITSFFDNILLFINLSKRLIIESDTHVIDIQSKQFDYGLNEKCNNLKDLIQDNQFKEALFIINLKLAELDEFLSCKDHFLNELIDYHTILELISDKYSATIIL